MPTHANSPFPPPRPPAAPAWWALGSAPVTPPPAQPNRRVVAPAHERRDGLATGSARPAEPTPGEAGPGQAFGRVRLRNTFSITSRGSADGREHHLVTAPKRGPERGKAREAILTVLRRADRQHHRVAIRLTLGDYTQLRVGPSIGLDPAMTLAQCHTQGDDPFEWCAREHLRQHAELVRADTIIGVELETWLPSGPARSHRPGAR